LGLPAGVASARAGLRRVLADLYEVGLAEWAPDERWRPALRGGVPLQAGAQLVEVVAPEGPVEGLGEPVVALFEGGEAFGDLISVGEVVRVEDLPEA